MLFDLASDRPDGPIHTDVCIIGSGPAGLALARALVTGGTRVVVLEAGPAVPELRSTPDNLVFDRSEYRGATLGRAHGFGGTSSLWGGQLLPVRAEEMVARPHIGAPEWPMDHDELARHFPTLDAWLGVTDRPFDLPEAVAAGSALEALDWLGFSPRLSKWIPFGARNLAKAWWPTIAATRKAQAWVNATVTSCDSVEATADRTVAAVQAHAANGHTLTVRPRAVVACAGALDSARLALQLLGPRSPPALGRYLHDHLSIRIAALDVVDLAGFAELFAPRFEGSTMRSLRLELSSALTQTAGLPAMYAHVVAEAPADSGFALLRDTLRSLQRRRPGEALRQLSRLPRAAPGIAEIAWWRVVKRRLAFPRTGRLFIHVDFEQPPRFANRIHLGSARPPQTGAPLHVDWDVGIDPSFLVKTMTDQLIRLWEVNRLHRRAILRPLDPAAVAKAWPTNMYDIYHPAGTTRMSHDAADGAVDPDLRLHGTTNAYVLSTSVFPSMGSANPTYTLLALALRLAGHLAPGPPTNG